MKRRMTIIADAVPHMHHGGGGVTAYSVLRALLDKGHRVSLVALESAPSAGALSDGAHVEHLRSLGAEVHVLPAALPRQPRPLWKKALPPGVADIFPSMARRAELEELLDSLSPDAVFMYHWSPLAAFHGARRYPKLGIVGDPIHLPMLFRRALLGKFEEQSNGPSDWLRGVKDAINRPAYLKAMKALLEDCDRCGAFAAHHAELFRDLGVTSCDYYQTPVPDPLPEAPARRLGPKLNILHIGHLQGTATLAGVDSLAREVLPVLEKELGPEGFEINLVGGYFDRLPKGLQKRLQHPAVKIRGQISPPHKEFMDAHVVLVPTPIKLGIRVRIITAFSYGSCIVTHEANKAGIPELESGRNSLLGRDGMALAQQCLAVFRDPSLREKLEKGARETYEAGFSLGAAGGRIADALENMAAMERTCV